LSVTKLLVGLFVGVFVGALAYEVIKKGEFARRAARRVSEGVQATRNAFGEGYRSIQQPSEQPLPTDAT
jgi:hypothetical protein